MCSGILVEKILQEIVKMLPAFSPFPAMFSKTLFLWFVTIRHCVGKVLQLPCLENTVGRGEITRNGQFLLFLQCFLPVRSELSVIFIKFEIVVCKLSVWKSLKFVVWEWVKG